MVHTSDGSLHLQKEGGVVVFVHLQLMAGIGNDANLALWVALGEASCYIKDGIHNEGVRAVMVRVVHDGLRAEVGL
jgi:hypothetical protein